MGSTALSLQRAGCAAFVEEVGRRSGALRRLMNSTTWRKTRFKTPRCLTFSNADFASSWSTLSYSIPFPDFAFPFKAV
ncbi:hypothetical protein ACN2CC_11245 [Mesorhizobium muleiense]|uniref:hypothetical protein n=1 Tax=Mesorhizobium muleiense TaxID=1004279 RepID=UPI003AFB5809